MTILKDRFPSRTIARPVANLGNTCYMNAVLQALSACPELCTALDCMPHRPNCTVYAENAAKSRASSPSASSNGSASAASDPNFSGDNNNNNNNEAAPRKTATRKSLRSSGRKSPPGDGKKSDWTFCALCELEEHLHKVHDDSLREQPVAPSTFVNGFMEHVAPWFELGQQEDSHEFLRLLIDAMQKSCRNARPLVKEILEDDNDDSPTASRTRSARNNKQKQVFQTSRDTEYPFSLFRGTVESTVTCESCQATSSTMDPIEDIGLEVLIQPGAAAAAAASTNRPALESVRSSSRNASPTPASYTPLADVTAAFQRFTSPEVLDAGYKCEKCGKVGRANKQSRLASIPPVLTLHLKRFRYGETAAAPVSRRSGREVGQLLSSQSAADLVYAGGSGSAKIEGHIKFEQLIDLRPYLTDELKESHEKKNMFCRLFAVVVHAGKNSHSGHYIAYVRNLGKKEEWWKMDDGRVTPVTLQQVKQAEAYMLFYRVLQHPVSTKLEQEYAKAKEEEELTKSEPKENYKTDSTLSSSGKTENAPQSTPSRKRRAECAFTNGEEWARSKTKPPPHFIEIVRKTEQKIADDIVMTTESITKLSERVSKNETSPSKKPGHSISGRFAVCVNPSCRPYRI
mmetsp:Transcript_1044/g.2095  ORF Transcript_1044/g.2095 Transcript_1044/m.2095 type:complete len:628 (-) Transcript_1044:59-1942(-)